jgi:hypothetical protein
LDGKSLKSPDTVSVQSVDIFICVAYLQREPPLLQVSLRIQPEIVPFPQTGDGRNGSLGD